MVSVITINLGVLRPLPARRLTTGPPHFGDSQVRDRDSLDSRKDRPSFGSRALPLSQELSGLPVDSRAHMRRCTPASGSRGHPRSVVAAIETSVVGRAIDPDPVGLVNAATVPRRRAEGERAGDLDPSVLLPRDGADLFCDFREVLVLAEDDRYVVLFSVRHADHVEGQPDVDPLLFARQKRMGGAIRQPDGLVAVPERSAEDVDALPAYGSELGLPETVPEGVVGKVRDTRVEADLGQGPATDLTEGMRRARARTS